MVEVEHFGEVLSLHQGKKIFGIFPPRMTVRCYAVDGLLIDSGLSCFKQQVLQFAGENKIQQTVITHHHEDHSGNCHSLQQEGFSLYSSQETAIMMKKGFYRPLYQKIVWANAPQADLQMVPEWLETDRYKFQVISAPGHCEDQIVLFEPSQGWLFTGDAFLSAKIKYFRGDENFQQTLQTLKRLCELSFDSVYCAHHPVLTQGKKSMQEKLDYLLEIEGKVKDLHRIGYPISQITKMVLGGESKILFAISLGDLSKRNLVKSILFGPVSRLR